MKNNAGTKEKVLAKEIWLNYFNNYLFKNSYISEQEYQKMNSKIASQTNK